MTIPKRPLLALRAASWALLSAALVALLPATARSGPLDEYTGYTRPGSSVNKNVVDIRPVAADKGDDDTIGVTVYFRVFNNSEGVVGDPFATGYKDLPNLFVAGKDPLGKNNSPKFDSSAKYLYLYQAVYDSGQKGLVRDVSVRLLVPTERITSWGHFAGKAEKDKQPSAGLGFNAEFPSARDKGKSVILPVSSQFEYQAVRDKLEQYLDPAPHFAPPRQSPYGVQGIALNNGIDPVDSGKWNVGRDPEAVMLLADADFGSRRPGRARDRALLAPPGTPQMVMGPAFGRAYYPFSGFVFSNPFDYAVSATSFASAEATSTAAIRAYFLDEPLRTGQRTTLFGFTTDLPPTYDMVRARGLPPAEFRPAAGAVLDPRANIIAAEGSVPTPIEAVGAVGAGASFGGLGGLTGGGGGSGGGFGGGFPGFGFAAPGNGGGTGGGLASSGNDSGTDQNQRQPQNQNQDQNQSQTPTFNVPVTVTQTASASARAAAAALAAASARVSVKIKNVNKNDCCCDNMQMVPEPAAVVSGLLGLPLLYLFGRRRRPAVA